MALKLKQVIEVKLTADEAERKQLFRAETPPGGQMDEIADADLVEYVADHRALAASASDTQVILGGLTTFKWLYIEADANLTIKIGGTDAARAITLKTRADGNQDRLRFCADVESTSLYLTNPSSTAAVNVTICAAGV